MIKDNNEPRTYKYLIAHRNEHTTSVPPLKGMRALSASLLTYAMKVPLLGTLLSRSFTIDCLVLAKLRAVGDYSALFTVLLNILLGPQFRHTHTHHWWYLMRFAVALLQERQINWFVKDLVLEDNLMFIGNHGPAAPRGYDAAYVYVGYSLWLFERGDVQGAINMIQRAVQADDTWGYPEYLHGWYGLFTVGVDSALHFTRAVNVDWSFLQRMRHDKTCRQHPEVLHEVQRRTLVQTKHVK